MNDRESDTPDLADATGWEHLCRDKALAELTVADGLFPGADAIAWSGDVLAEVVLVKGEPGPAEVAGGAALSGPDGSAAAKALGALGFDPASLFATVARPEPEVEAGALAERIRIQIEAVDPSVVIALDSAAAGVVRTAFSLGVLKPGRPLEANGRTCVAVDDLEASLSEEARKRRVWQQLKSVSPRPPAW